MTRGRKEWPPYFSLSINEIPGQVDENGQRAAALAIAKVSMINEKLLFDDVDDDKKSSGSIGSDDVVMFVNPCMYTLEVDTTVIEPMGEVSAFDPEIIEEEENKDLLGGDKGMADNREQLYNAIKSGEHEMD